ncbi:hypothetical protein [Streptomyces sp. NPDC093568]|uniref:hypothetical protein n=1 Tax=Streptomyces sp. NPDC093568 TaxID=3366041 RepID=UPI00380A9EB5
MREVACHEVGEVPDDIGRRTWGRRHSMRYDGVSLAKLRSMGDDLLDDVAASGLKDPALGNAGSFRLRAAGSQRGAIRQVF